MNTRLNDPTSQEQNNAKSSVATQLSPEVLDSMNDSESLQSYVDENKVDLFAALEALDIADIDQHEPGVQIVENAIAAGLISAGDTVVESSASGLGLGLAQACQNHDLKFIYVVDVNVSDQDVTVIRTLGGKIDLVIQPYNGDLNVAKAARVLEINARVKRSYWPSKSAKP